MKPDELFRITLSMLSIDPREVDGLNPQNILDAIGKVSEAFKLWQNEYQADRAAYEQKGIK